MNNEKSIRLGFIGCGRISLQHLPAIQQHKENIKLVAVCDREEDRAKEVAEKYDIPYYTNYKDLLKRKDIDIVTIATPNGLHFEMGYDAALAGKHVLLEKPMTITLKETDRLIDIFKKKKKILFAVKQVRYNPAILVVKDIIEQRKLGKIYSASLVMRWTRPAEYYKGDPWRGTKAMDGGSLLNQGIHYIDILQWFLGPVKSVFGKVDCVAHDIEIEDEAFANITFENGAYANVEFTLNTYPRNLECSITLLGSEGTVKIGGTAVNTIEMWEIKNLPKPIIPEGLAPNIYAGGLYQGSCPNHTFVYKSIIKALKHNGKEYTNGEEARKSLEIVHAIYESSRAGQEIRLPLQQSTEILQAEKSTVLTQNG